MGFILHRPDAIMFPGMPAPAWLAVASRGGGIRVYISCIDRGDVVSVAQTKGTKHIRTVSEGAMKGGLAEGGCKECQASCQSACKTSCTVGNQVCRQRGK